MPVLSKIVLNSYSEQDKKTFSLSSSKKCSGGGGASMTTKLPLPSRPEMRTRIQGPKWSSPHGFKARNSTTATMSSINPLSSSPSPEDFFYTHTHGKKTSDACMHSTFIHQNTGYPRLGEMLLTPTPTATCTASPMATETTSTSICSERTALRGVAHGTWDMVHRVVYDKRQGGAGLGGGGGGSEGRTKRPGRAQRTALARAHLIYLLHSGQT